MALITSLGSLGTASVKTPGDKFSFSLGSTVPVGGLVIVWAGWESMYNLATDGGGPYQDRLAIADNTGENFWDMLACGTGTNCYFFCSATCAIYACRLRAQLTPSHIITLYGQNSTTEPKAVSAWEFDIADGYGYASIDSGFSYLEERPGTGAQMNYYVGGLDSQEYLMLHGLAYEGPDTDSWTWDSNYTQIDPDGTTGGADDTNISIRGGFRSMDPGTGDSVDVQNNTSARDLVQLFGAITPVPIPTSFPTRPILDDFNRADETPLDNGTWNQVETCGPSSPGFRVLGLTGNEAYGGATNAGGSWWLDIVECNDVEVYATGSLVNDGTSLGIDVACHGSGSTSAANGGGYNANWRPYYGVHGSSPPMKFWKVQLGYLGNQGGVHQPAVFLWLPEGQHPETGWKIGIKRVDEFNHLYLDIGGGWEWFGCTNTQSGNRPNRGYLGLAVWDPISRADDFGGGGTCFMVATNTRSAVRNHRVLRGV